MLGKRLKELREKEKLTQGELAEKLGIGRSSITMFESGDRQPSRETLENIADFFNVNMDYLYGRSDESKTIVGPHSIPLLGRIAAGFPIMAEENVEDLIAIDEHTDADFVIRVNGESMTGACIFDGDLAFIKQQPELENGEIGAILVNGEMTLKRFYKDNGIVTLVSENAKYKPMVFTNGDMRILGRLVACLRFF